MNFNGLTNEQVNKQIKQGNINTIPKPEVRSTKDIIFSHIFTPFNLYNFIIAGALLYVKAYTSLFFMGIVLSNIIIFSTQEVRSRNLVKKLNIIIAPTTMVVRNGEILEIPNEELVLGDLIYLKAGDQISADSVIVDGNIEVNESLLTGEMKPVDKSIDSELLSGSFVVSGTCYAQVMHVGLDNYAVKITQAVKKPKKNTSELMHTFKTVTKITSFFIIPIGAILLFQSLGIRHESLSEAIVNTSTALLGMLPQGLVILTTISLVGSVLTLGSHKTLVQNLYSIEVLSGSDVLCLDKTGTLTLGEMTVVNTEVVDDNALYLLNCFVSHSVDNNATAFALKNYVEGNTYLEEVTIIPFASERKWSAIMNEDYNLILGAPEYIDPNLEMPQTILDNQENGARILLFANANAPISKDDPLPTITPLMWIAIQDPLREDTKEAISFFKANDVAIKVISGDNPKTVGIIASQAGIANELDVIDASKLTTQQEMEDAILNYNIIGRATPNQKLEFTKILQNHNKKVAMTGDGINDVLALKNADVSIAMGEGSDAAIHISQIVIMDGKISTLVDVVKEGRQVINNITRSASMYYLRNIIALFMAMSAVVLNVVFPFIPFQITLSNMFIDGFPSFMILFEKNYHKPKDKILINVLKQSVPNGLAIIILWIWINVFSDKLGLNQAQVQTIMFYLNGFVSLQMIYRIYKPLNLYRSIVLIIDAIGFGLGIWLFWDWLELVVLTSDQIKLTLILMVVATILVYILLWIIHQILNYFRNKKEQD